MWPLQHIIQKMACTSRQKQNLGRSNRFWNEDVNIKRTCLVTAEQYGFSGNMTATSTTNVDTAYEQLVNDFSSAFDKSQTTISGLTATNTQLQQQLQQEKNDVPSHDKSRISSNILDAFPTTTTNTDPATKLK